MVELSDRRMVVSSNRRISESQMVVSSNRQIVGSWHGRFVESSNGRIMVVSSSNRRIVLIDWSNCGFVESSSRRNTGTVVIVKW